VSQALSKLPSKLSGNRFALWRLFDDLVYSISAPDYVIRALGERIQLCEETEKKQNQTAHIVWNPDSFDGLKAHFWKGNLGPECLVEYQDAEKHLFLGAFHYELLDTKTGNIQFYSHTDGKNLHNQFGYPFL
jgi:hypothetical protein